MYNLKNRDCQLKFKELTSNNDNLSIIFDNEEDLNKATNLFMKKLSKNIKTCFKKVRVSDKPNMEIEELFLKRKQLRNKTDEESITKLKEIESKLAELCADKNYNKICEEISDIKCDEGGIHSGKLWQLKKKLSPKCRDPPTAMLDLEGNLVTSAHEIEKLSVEIFKDRLRNRPMKAELSELKKKKIRALQIENEAGPEEKDSTMDNGRLG